MQIFRFEISPGEEALKKMYEEEKTPNGRYQQFSSFPTAFIVAADIELSVSIKSIRAWYFSELT